MTISFNPVIADLPYPATIAMSRKARELKAAGADIISLAIGEPDFPSPKAAIEAAYHAALDGQTKYPPVDGTKDLKEAIRDKFKRDNHLDYQLEEIIVSNGGKQGIFNALMATLSAGDEVVIPTPYWVSYPIITKMMGGRPVFVSCPQENGFHLRPEDLDAKLTPRTRWLILNYPCNPTGAMYSAEALQAIARVMRRYPQCLILCDEMYEHLAFDQHQHLSLAYIAPDLKERILTLNGVSKAYAMTGWRVGFSGGPKALIAMMRKIQGNCTSGICSVAQAAAAQALRGSDKLVHDMARTYDKRRQFMVSALQNMPSIDCNTPQGTFYVFPGIKNCLNTLTPQGRTLKTDMDFSQAFLEEENVATVPGAAFGCSPYLRLSCATSDAHLEIAVGRLRAFIEKLRPLPSSY